MKHLSLARPCPPRTVEINPASCLSTTLWRGHPGESVSIEIQGLWIRVVGDCPLEWKGPESVDLTLVAFEEATGEFHQIGPLPYSGVPMIFGPYDFQAAVTAHVHCDYVIENQQKTEDPLRATIRERHPSKTS